MTKTIMGGHAAHVAEMERAGKLDGPLVRITPAWSRATAEAHAARGESPTRSAKQEPAHVHTDAIMEKYGVNLDTQEWLDKDDAVATQRSEESARNRQRALVNRGKRIVACGAPELDVELIVSGQVDKDSKVMGELSEWWAASSVSHPICVLSGSVGVGKTVAAVRWLMNHGGKSPCFVRTGDFEARSRYSHVWRNEWQTATGMILDDMSVEYKDAKGSLLADLDTLIDTYARSRARLIITTNLPWQAKNPEDPDFQKRYEDRIASRIVGSATWINVAGPDLRRKS